MQEEPLEALSLLPADEAARVDHALDVTESLAVSELILAELRAILAEMASVSGAGEPFVRPDPAARPAEVASSLPSPAHRCLISPGVAFFA
jgi:hypothetical protein